MDEVREGYKFVKGVGEIPKEWPIYKLIDILSEAKLGGNYKCVEKRNNKPLIKMGNIDRGKISINNLNYIDENELINENDLLKEGDLLFNTRNTLELVGKVAIWRNEISSAYYNSNLLKLTFDNKKINSNYYMNYVLNSYYSLAQLKSFAIGTTSVAAIYNRDLMKLKLALPTLKEQQKISQILSTWDEAIDKTEKLIEKKKLQKKGLTQQLLTGKKRLKEFEGEDWEELKLKDFLKPITREVEKPTEAYEAIGIRSHGKGTFDKYVEDPSTVSMNTLYEVKENDLIVNITFAWEGAIAISKKSDEGKLVSHRFPTYIFDRSKAISEYFKYVIVQPRFIYLLGLISPGGAGRNRVMSKTDFLKLKVTLPSVKEQKSMANILTTADKEINLLEQKLQVLKEQKKGLMQNLLTGKVRVKV